MKKYAFTLAEVLITLGIIGIVAAMTMPALVANYQKKVTVTKLKKVSSTLSQGCKMALADDGVSEIAETGFYHALGSYGMNDYSSAISKYYKIIGDVNTVHYSFSSELPDNSPTGSSYVFEFYLSDGTKVYLYSYPNAPSNTNNEYLYFYVNINPGRKEVYKNVDLFAISLNENCNVGSSGYTSQSVCNVNGYYSHYFGCFDSIVRDGWEIKYDFASMKRAQDSSNGSHHY